MGKQCVVLSRLFELTLIFDSFAMYGFWGSILLIGMIRNAYNILWHSRSGRGSNDPEKSYPDAQTLTQTEIAFHWLKTNFIIPTLFGTYHRRLWYSFAIPTRIEALIIIFYWSISIILCSVNFKTFEGNL
jgi:hypothetical protein